MVQADREWNTLSTSYFIDTSLFCSTYRCTRKVGTKSIGQDFARPSGDLTQRGTPALCAGNLLHIRLGDNELHSAFGK